MIPGKHMLFNLAATTPINVAASLARSPGGWKTQAATGPLGIYSAYRAGQKMDEGNLSEGDAILNAGLLAHNISHIAQSKMPSENMFGNFAAKIGLTPHSDRALALAAGTIGLGLPLYFYYRQFLKKPEEEENVDNTGGLR